MLATDHDRQCSVDRADIATAYRRIKHAYTLFLERRGHFLCHLGRNRAHVDHDHTLFDPVDRTVLADEHRLHIGRVSNDTDHDIGTGRRFFRRTDANPTGVNHLLYPGPVTAVVHVELIAGLEQILGHGGAHDPQADKADLRLSRCCWHGSLSYLKTDRPTLFAGRAIALV